MKEKGKCNARKNQTKIKLLLLGNKIYLQNGKQLKLTNKYRGNKNKGTKVARDLDT